MPRKGQQEARWLDCRAGRQTASFYYAYNASDLPKGVRAVVRWLRADLRGLHHFYTFNFLCRWHSDMKCQRAAKQIAAGAAAAERQRQEGSGQGPGYIWWASVGDVVLLVGGNADCAAGAEQRSRKNAEKRSIHLGVVGPQFSRCFVRSLARSISVENLRVCAIITYVSCFPPCVCVCVGFLDVLCWACICKHVGFKFSLISCSGLCYCKSFSAQKRKNLKPPLRRGSEL